MLPNQPTYNDNHQSILIVDDDSLVLELLSQGLIMFGFQVFEVDNGIDAWNTFQKEQIDVVLTDINMPGLDGKELSHRIRNQSPSTIIAVMTGGAYDVATDLIEDGTVNYFFPKPLKLIELCKSLMAEVQPA